MCVYALTVFIWRAKAISKKQVSALQHNGATCRPDRWFNVLFVCASSLLRYKVVTLPDAMLDLHWVSVRVCEGVDTPKHFLHTLLEIQQGIRWHD